MSPKREPLQPLSAVGAPADETATVPALPPTYAAPPDYAPPQRWKAQPDTKETVRRTGLALALVFLAISLAIAYYSANSILSIWFEYQYTPIVRLVLALGVAATSIWVVMRLTRKA
jgi:hypothetical protein